MAFFDLFKKKKENTNENMISKSDIAIISISKNNMLNHYDIVTQYVKDLYCAAFDFYKKDKIFNYEFFNSVSLLFCLGATIISPIMSDDDWQAFNSMAKKALQDSLSQYCFENFKKMTYHEVGSFLQNRTSVLYSASAQAYNTSSIGYVGAVFGTIWANDNHFGKLTLFDINDPMTYLTSYHLKNYCNQACELCESISPVLLKICNKVLLAYEYKEIKP